MKQSVFGNSKNSKVWLVAGILLIALAVWQMVGIVREYQQGRDTYQDLETAVVSVAEEESTTDSDVAQEEETAKEPYQMVAIDFEALKEVNEDVIGWLQFDNNGISYPLLQGEDNETYLHKMADGSPHKAGSIFMDTNCSSDLSDSHTIIYGHNMRDLSMFGKLKKYRNEEGYYEENKYFTVYTPEMIYRYEIFGWYQVPEVDPVYQLGFVADATFEAFVEQMLARRDKDTGVTADKEDKIVTLSTCSTTGNRLVVHGKQINVCPAVAVEN